MSKDELSKLRFKIKCLEQSLAWEKKQNQQNTAEHEEPVDEYVIGDCTEKDVLSAIKVLAVLKKYNVSSSQNPHVNELITTIRDMAPKPTIKEGLEKEISTCTTQYALAPLLHKSMLNEKVIKLQFQVNFEYEAGQYIYLTRKFDGLTRRYSIGSVRQLDGNIIELNARHVMRGEMTTWLKSLEENSQEEFLISGPKGSSTFKHDIDINTPILMVGVGTGMTPLYAVLREALLVHGHTGHIHMVHSNTMMEHAYYIPQLLELEKTFSNFTYYPCVRDVRNIGSYFDNDTELDRNRVLVGKLDDIVVNNFRNLSGTVIYTCGFSSAMRHFWSRLVRECYAKECNLINDPLWK
jgi:NAD(P)H-flavin reductase